MSSGLPAVLFAHAIRASVSHCLTKLRRVSPASFCLMAFALQVWSATLALEIKVQRAMAIARDFIGSPFLGRDTILIPQVIILHHFVPEITPETIVNPEGAHLHRRCSHKKYEHLRAR